MNPNSDIALVEEIYGRILVLANEQHALLLDGRIADLGPVIQKKADAVEEAAVVMAKLKGYAGEENQRIIREGIKRLSLLVAEVMEVEDRCQKLYAAPLPTPKAPPAGRVASLYQKNRR